MQTQTWWSRLIHCFSLLLILAPNSDTCNFYNGNITEFNLEYKDFLKQYFLAQIDGFESGSRGKGWYFWTAKTENNSAAEWDFLLLIKEGILPNNLCARQSI